MTRDLILSLLQTLFPGVRFYVMLASDGEWNGIISNCWGETGRTFDVVNRELLEARGMWKGRGRAIFVNDVPIKQFADENAAASEMTADELFRKLIASVVTHEAGHVAEQGLCFTEPSPLLSKYASLVSAYSVDY